MLNDIRQQDPKKIKSTIIQLKSRLLEYRFKAAQGDFVTTHLIRECKKTIAKLLTVLREKNEKLTNKDWKEFLAIYKEEHEKQVKEAMTLQENMKKAKETEEIKEETVKDAPSKKTEKEVSEKESVKVKAKKTEKENVAKEDLKVEDKKTSTKTEATKKPKKNK